MHDSTLFKANKPFEIPKALKEKSEKLKQKIIAEIHQSSEKHIDFSDFMAAALYDDEYGYYTTQNAILGEAGDFITAPTLGNLFAGCLSHLYEEVVDTCEGRDILELGPGTGQLGVDLLHWLPEDIQPKNYYFLEKSPTLIQTQKSNVEKNLPQNASIFQWISSDTLPKIEGLIILNEFFDALPARTFKIINNAIFEKGVTEKASQLDWCYFPVTDPDEATFLNSLKTTHNMPEGYQFEYHFQQNAWLKKLAQTLTRGRILIIDYGFKAEELYHPQRHMGTLKVHYQHHSLDDPLAFPGIQDITTHINFTQLMHAATQHQLQILEFTTLAQFLIKLDLTELIHHPKRKTHAPITPENEILKLTHPGEMGELFKVLLLEKTDEV